MGLHVPARFLHGENEMEISSLLNTHPLVLLDFHATWCEPCRWAEPIVEEVLKHFQGKIVLHKIDIDEHPSLAKDHHILSVPTFVLYRNGEEVWRMRGFDTVPKMIRSLEEKLK